MITGMILMLIDVMTTVDVLLCRTHSFGLVGTEETRVVAFLNHYVSDAGLVVFFQFDAGVSDGQQLIM